jgi:hypothetical protein
MRTKSALQADLGAENRKTLAEDRKRMERLGKCSELDDWLAFGVRRGKAALSSG